MLYDFGCSFDVADQLVGDRLVTRSRVRIALRRVRRLVEVAAPAVDWRLILAEIGRVAIEVRSIEERWNVRILWPNGDVQGRS